MVRRIKNQIKMALPGNQCGLNVMLNVLSNSSCSLGPSPEHLSSGLVRRNPERATMMRGGCEEQQESSAHTQQAP